MRVIDSHTGGEPTRVILDGGPDLGGGSLAERAARLATEHKDLYRAIMLEPRGQPAMVGAFVVDPVDPNCAVGVIYFDAAAVIGMCGHGTIGLAVTLHRTGLLPLGTHMIETPAGRVRVTLHDGHTVTVENIESRLVRRDVTLDVAQLGLVTGDLAYGGNWFFIVDPSPLPLEPDNIPALTEAAKMVRAAAWAQNICGEKGEAVDHVIFQAPSPVAGVLSRNFTLCPDDAYDRSPCGTGSSARLACLAARGGLPPETEIIQESIIGSQYRLSYRPGPQGGVLPSITGAAFITAESRLFFQEGDPFVGGIHA
ncbi:proline racemase family protein [Epibacterium ulvae]|uniref:4-hydroxyproline epimerase n=1 Tax=Epibacterium ulvae TaxID=1156985 RepID=UPI001BFC9CA9|nr:proline racemase family protein [Epibacterium ulvae]MBT8154094.1 proline racemase family protein [Epibacterium ulvae]